MGDDVESTILTFSLETIFISLLGKSACVPAANNLRLFDADSKDADSSALSADS